MRLTADLILRAYAMGVFPMARDRDDPKLYWVDPDQRGILPLETFHVSRSLRKQLRRGLYSATCDRAFERIIRLCGEPAPDRPETWINETIVGLFLELHERGLAHSVEIWSPNGLLAGGLYGLALGGAFFGESMVSRAPGASKIALVHLVARLKQGGFTLLDTQFVTEHLTTFGAIEIPRDEYHRKLADALAQPAVFYGDLGDDPLDALFSQSNTQMS